MKYSICIDAVCRGLDSVDALDKVKAAGFKAFEFWQWTTRDLDALKKKADALGLSCVSFSGGAQLTDPKTRDMWIEGLKDTVNAVKKMGSSHITITVGDDTGAVRRFQHRSIVDSLKAAAPIFEKNNIIMLLEPINGRLDHIGTYLESSDEAFEIIDEVGSKNLKMLFDIYHQQITEGDIIRRMTSRIKDIGHVHSAGSINRLELDIGELDYRRIFAALDEAGYDGYAGLEYLPTGDSLASLKRMYDYLQ